MKVQVLMAATDLNQGTDLPHGLKDLIQNDVKYTVINQCAACDKDSFLNDPGLHIYSFSEKGLSKSRNRNLDYLSEEIGLITDQDVRFKKGFQDTIINAFKKFPKADIITFQIEDEHALPFKNYKKEACWMNQRDIMKVSSIEIAFRASSILDNKIIFDEDFGLGSTYETGEEAIFLSDALNKGLKIKYIPLPIVVHPGDSSGYKFSQNKPLIRSKGAMFYRLFKQKAYLISIIFAVKKYKLSSEGLINFVKLMFEGISSYKSSRNE